VRHLFSVKITNLFLKNILGPEPHLVLIRPWTIL